MGTDTPDNYLFCNGSTYSKSTYPDLYNVLKTETLPNLDGLFLQGSSTPNQKKSAGLPNIIGKLGWVVSWTGGASGAFKLESSNNSESGTGFQVARDFSFSARNGEAAKTGVDMWTLKSEISSPKQTYVYGESDTVQPPALTVRYIIRAK